MLEQDNYNSNKSVTTDKNYNKNKLAEGVTEEALNKSFVDFSNRLKLEEEEQQLKEAKQQQLAQQTEEGAAEVAKDEAEVIEAPVADEKTPTKLTAPVDKGTYITGNQPTKYGYDSDAAGADLLATDTQKTTDRFLKDNATKLLSTTKDPKRALAETLGRAIVENNAGRDLIDLRKIVNTYNEVNDPLNTDAVLKAADTAYAQTRPSHYVDLDAEYELSKDDSILKSLQDGILTGKNKYSGEYNNSLDLFDRNLAYEKLEASIEADPKYANYTSKQKEAVINRGINIIEQKQLMNTAIADNIELKDAIKANKAFKAEADILASNARITAETAIGNYASMLSEKLQKEAQGLDPAQHDELVNKYDLLLENYQRELNSNNIPKLKKQFEDLKKKHGVNESIDIGAELQKGAKELVQEKYDLNHQRLNEYASSVGGFGHMALMNFGVGGVSTVKSMTEIINPITSKFWDFDISVLDKELNAATALVAPDIDPNIDMADEIFTPAFWATKGAQTAPLTFALMGTGMGISAGLAALTGSARMAILQSSALGNVALAGFSSRPIESLIEGSQVYSEAIMAGHSVQDASTAAWKVAAFNMPLMVLDAIPFLPLLTKMKAPITKLGAVASTIGLGVFDALTEAPEEVYQGYLAENAAYTLDGKEYSFMDHIIDKSTGEFTNQMIEEAALGVGMGIMMGGPATVADLTNLDYLMKEDGNWNNVREYIDGMIASGHLNGDPESILKAKMSLNTMYNRLNIKRSQSKFAALDKALDVLTLDKLTAADKYVIDNLDDETYNRAMDYLSVLSDLPAFIESTSNLNASLAGAKSVFTKGEAVLPTITELEQFKKKLSKYKLITSGGLPEEDKIDEGVWDKLRKNLLMDTQARADYDAKIADKLKNLRLDREQANELSDELIADVDNLTTEGYQLEALIALHKLGLSDKVTEHINALENTNKTVEDLNLAPERVDNAKAALKLLEEVDLSGNTLMNTALQNLIKDNPEVAEMHLDNTIKNQKVNGLRNINAQIEAALAEANENYRTNPTYKKQALNVINAHLKAKQNVNMYDNLAPKSDRKVESISKMLTDTLNDISATSAEIKGPSKKGYKLIESTALTNARKEKLNTLNKNKDTLEQALEAANAENAQIKEAQSQAQTLYRVNNAEEMLKSLQKDPTTSGKLKDKLNKIAKRLKTANEGAKRTAARLAKKAPTPVEVVEETNASTSNIEDIKTQKDEIERRRQEELNQLEKELNDLGIVVGENNLKEAAEKLLEDIQSPFIRQVLKALLHLISKTGTKLIITKGDVSGMGVSYDHVTNTIQINLDTILDGFNRNSKLRASGGRDGFILQTFDAGKGKATPISYLATQLLHETIHAFTTRQINSFEKNSKNELTEEEYDIIQKIQDVFNYIKNNKILQAEYGISDIHELLAELFSNETFADKLKNISLPKELQYKVKSKNLFEGIINLISDLITKALKGFSKQFVNNEETAFQNISNLVNDLINAKYDAELVALENTAEEVNNEVHNEVVSTTITEEVDNELTGEGLFNDNVLQTDLEVDEQQGESILVDGKKNLNPVGSVAYLDLQYEEDHTTGKITTTSNESTTLAINALDPSIQVDDKIELRVLTEDEFVPYTDKDGVVYQYQDLVNLANSQNEPFTNYMPVGIYHNGKQIGFLHIPSWITKERVPESKVNIVDAKSKLIRLRQLLETEKSITTVITDISLGSIRKNIIGRANTAVTMPDDNIMALIGTKNNQLLDGTQSNYNPKDPVIPNKASKKIQPGLKYMALPVDGKILITPIYDLRVSAYEYNNVNAKQITDTIIEALKVFADGNKQSPLRQLIIDNYDNLDITNAQDLEAFIQLFIPTTSITKKNTDILEATEDGKQFRLKKNGLTNKRAYFGLVPTERGTLINFINTDSYLTTIDILKVKDNVEVIRKALLMMRLNSSASRINTKGEFTLVVMQGKDAKEIKYKNYNEYFKSTTETPLTSVKLGETDTYSYFAQRVIQFETPVFEAAGKDESTDEVEIATPASKSESAVTKTETEVQKADIGRIKAAKELHIELLRDFTTHNLNKKLVKESLSNNALEEEKNKWNTEEEAQKAIDDEIESVSEKIEYWINKGLPADEIIKKIMPPLNYAGNPLRFMLINGKQRIINFIKAKVEGKVNFTLQEAHKISEKEINAKYDAELKALDLKSKSLSQAEENTELTGDEAIALLGLPESIAETETPNTEADASINALDGLGFDSPVLQENNEIIKNNFMGPLAVRAISSQSAFKALKYCKG